MATDISERGFENIIVGYFVKNNGYELGKNEEYNKNYATDEGRLFRYLKNTQSKELENLRIMENDLERKKFLEKLDKKISEDGLIKIMRNGFEYKHGRIEIYQHTPSPENKKAVELYEKNIFSITRQLHYSQKNTRLSLDIVIFINGLPIITMELKNNFTNQNVSDAIRQYKKDRDPSEKIFNFKRCLVHFAVDDEEIYFCTKLAGEESQFMPFNKGNDDGAGNPPCEGTKTEYLWKEILTKSELSNILENYAQIIEEKNQQIFPRYHQLKVVEKLLRYAKNDGAGHKYLIQHSAGSGKSNSIAWLAHQLVTLRKDDKKIFDTVIIVTDRKNLDKQINQTVGQFMQIKTAIGHAKSSRNLRDLFKKGKNIVITIVHKFHEVAKEIDKSHKNKKFAVIIDEAHSSQNGNLAANMNQVISGIDWDSENDIEDKINALLESKKTAKNASYFAFTATPKNKTLELFGNNHKEAHDIYSMKQAIEEGFILDVLKNYTPYRSYYKIIKTVEEEKYFNKKNVNKILSRYAENTKLAITEKSGIIIEHFYNNVRLKIKKKARAMIVADGIKSAIEYYFAIMQEFESRNSKYKAIMAFSGEYEYNGEIYTESKINNFPSVQIEEKFRQEPYRILIVADKFQTGYDEPLLQTMYVDKKISDIKAVQTLSRLNRCMSGKYDTCNLDFANDPAEIQKAFSRYYKTTILSGETDFNKLNDLIDKIKNAKVFSDDDMNRAVEMYLKNENRSELDSIFDRCRENYKNLDDELQAEFKSNAKFFIKIYNFLSAVIPFNSVDREKLSIFLTILLTKLPKVYNNVGENITENIDLENYRSTAQDTLNIILENENAEINPVSIQNNFGTAEPELDTLTHILSEFNKHFGDLYKSDKDAIKLQMKKILSHASEDSKLKNALASSDEQNINTEINRAVGEAISITSKIGNKLLLAYYSNEKNQFGQIFRTWLNDTVKNYVYLEKNI